ncbi:hypothetical protein [Niveispirillum sp. KHB5.9]|uniref:hypothetical protein n=1 Tax=Niveispirillum sp. KHB5.9 TaxID=3400269 RepID=UPI003A8614AE
MRGAFEDIILTVIITAFSGALLWLLKMIFRQPLIKYLPKIRRRILIIGRFFAFFLKNLITIPLIIIVKIVLFPAFIVKWIFSIISKLFSRKNKKYPDFTPSPEPVEVVEKEKISAADIARFAADVEIHRRNKDTVVIEFKGERLEL